MIVAVDGPAGVGKSSVSKLVAYKLGITHLDSGAIYRALTYIKINYPDQFETLLTEPLSSFLIKLEGGQQKIYYLAEDITKFLRNENITKQIKFVADLPECRAFVNQQMRNFSKSHSLIVDGRDIGTIVFPDADFKFFLVADPKIRATRRAFELGYHLEDDDFKTILDSIVKRDHEDKNRSIAPLVPASDSITVDTSSMDINQVVEFIYNKIQKLNT